MSTEDGLRAIADKLYVSRRTLERYVSAIYEKTGAKSRIGLISLYNSI
ncbi:MAG: LuxR C-terminal-related transcriptional regulator [Acutalibacteraceae bacterium]